MENSMICLLVIKLYMSVLVKIFTIIWSGGWLAAAKAFKNFIHQ